MPTTEENDRRKIGLRLKEMREYLGLSQDEVAKALKMPRPAVSLIESGERKVDALELKKFADLYQQPVDYFVSEKADNARTAKEPAHLQRAPRDVAQLARTATKLSPEDRSELVRFAEFLRSKPKSQ
jgi:transcriptional regulator with XRE-family HTH domain